MTQEPLFEPTGDEVPALVIAQIKAADLAVRRGVHA